MSSIAFTAVMVAALVHAAWNALIKSAGNKLLTTIAVASAAAIIAALLLPWVEQPAPASWPFIAISSLLTAIYFVLLARLYHVADMSQSYPIMRGTAPLLVALASAALGERLSLTGWLGVCAISIGMLSIAATPRGLIIERRGLYLALGNAVLIASCALIDGIGVRRSGAPLGYLLWVFLLSGAPLGAWAVARCGPEFATHLFKYWHFGLIGGTGSLLSYGVALWAMTLMPIPLVVALRETSIVFGTAIAWLWLRESVGLQRLGATCIIALGAAVLRMA